MAEDIEKTGPVKLLEGRRKALLKWLAEGQAAIEGCEADIKQHKEQAIEMVAEMAEIEDALKALYTAEREKLKGTENAT